VEGRQVHAPKTPHEYTLRRDAKDEALFERVVMHIRQVGYQQKWGKTTYTYLDLDIWQYWTMGSPLDETILINRAILRCMMSHRWDNFWLAAEELRDVESAHGYKQNQRTSQP
jgi:hypothetical protein